MFHVNFLDPCVDRPIQKRSSLCLAKTVVKGKQPQWLTDLSDQFIGFGLNYTYPMGPPVDDFGNMIPVYVNLRSAAGFVSYSAGPENALQVDGAKMFDRKTSYFHVTVQVLYIDIFGIEQFHKRDIYFIVAQLIYPQINFSD